MADVTLHDGREITFDLYRFTFSDYLSIFDKEKGDEKADEIIALAAGMTREELQALPYPDNRKVIKKFFNLCRDVMADPNSESAPT